MTPRPEPGTTGPSTKTPLKRGSKKKRVRVMAVGVFDIIHLGHIHYLEAARGLGDELVVVVSTDKMVMKRKHVPITPQEMRVRLVGALKPVDNAVLGHTDDQLKSVEDVRPDIIALGYDDYHNVDELKRKLAERGLHPEIVRVNAFRHDLDGTRKIIRKIFDSGLFESPVIRDLKPQKEGTEGQ
ncbi:MAG: FAD synthase [Euryarchaeota archaeon]|nr:FAD synthase [Euryarchaeota archaeon]